MDLFCSIPNSLTLPMRTVCSMLATGRKRTSFSRHNVEFVNLGKKGASSGLFFEIRGLNFDLEVLLGTEIHRKNSGRRNVRTSVLRRCTFVNENFSACFSLPETPAAAQTIPGIGDEEASMWRKRAAEFITDMEGTGTVEEEQKRGNRNKLQRVTAWKVLHAVNHQLSMLGLPLSRFAGTSCLEKEVIDRPLLVVTTDTGSDMTCVGNYLCYKRGLRACFWPDPIHRVWRALWNGTQSSGLWPVCLLANVVLNFSHGPFSSAAWHQELMSAAERFEKVEAADGPFMRFLTPFLREDESFRSIGWESLCDTELREQYRTELRDGWFLRSKGPKVSSTRWGTMHVALKHLFGQWGHLLGVVLSLGFSAGWMRQGAGAIIMERLGSKQPCVANDGQ
eukprot:6492413-Amphidinium_carterae.2